MARGGTRGPSRPSGIDSIIERLHSEAAVEDEDGGVSLSAVASSLLARWVEREHRAARACEAAMGERLQNAEAMLAQVGAGAGGGGGGGSGSKGEL